MQKVKGASTRPYNSGEKKYFVGACGIGVEGAPLVQNPKELSSQIQYTMKSRRQKIMRAGLITTGTLLFVVALTAAGTGFPVKLNEFILGLKGKLKAYEDHAPEDRVYVQFDKPFYKPGDDIWFSTFVRDARTFQKSRKSDIVHVELVNPKGNVQEKMKIVMQEGMAKGDFKLSPDAAGGMYKLRAYTQWQDNQKNPFKFEKEFQVQAVVLPNLKMKLEFDRKAYGPGDKVTATLELATNENQALAAHAFNYVASLDGATLTELKGKTDAAGKAKLDLTLPAELVTNDGLVNVMISYNGLTESISRSIPITLNKIDLQLFPEGGDLVEGLPSKVAFRALNEFGKPADIEGVVMDAQGAQISTFKSFHQGMGSFNFHPGKGHSYHVKITKPEGITATYEMPEALPRGFVLNVPKVEGREMLATINSTETEALSLVAQVRGEIYWASEVSVVPGKTDVLIPLGGFPMGVCQLTLFDSKGIERAERLAFVNRDRQLKVAVTTNKEKYLPREKVSMTVKVTDERGMPMPANLALSVVSDQLISFADDKSGHILSQMLLEPDLNTKVEEPKFYFDTKETKSLAALDNLMLTTGWRRFVWEEVQSGQLPGLKNQGERAIVGGRVLDGYTGQPVANASISVPGNNYGMLADKEGKFALQGLDLGMANSLNVTADGYNPTQQPLNDYNGQMAVYLYPTAVTYHWGNQAQVADANVAVELNEVMVVKAAPAAPVRQRAVANKAAGKAAPAPEMKKMKADKEADFAPVMEIPMEVEEERMDAPMVDNLRDDDGIEPMPKEKQLPDPKNPLGEEQARDQNQGGELAGFVMDNRFGRIVAMDSIVMAQQAQPAKYHRAREFAAPVYGAGSKAPATRTDFRETLYWNPFVKVDRTGKAVLEFYASDELTSFRIITEGIGHDGTVGRAEHVFYTQLPFTMQARVPAEVATDDNLVVPVVLKNNTDGNISGSLHVVHPAGLEPLAASNAAVTIAAGQAKVVNLLYKVLHKPGEEMFNIAFSGEGHTDAFEQKLKIVPQGFPVNISFSSSAATAKYDLVISKPVTGSISASFTAFPNVVTDLVKGIESILREPYGCFEQTSTSSYPNAMVMSYMKEQNDIDPALMKRATDLLDKGYKRLSTYECSQNGYEWFGSNPPHEALTAYGLMQFNDYGKVYDGVDRTMVDRTAKWLLSRRDGKGGFKRDGKALDSFGRADEDVTNAYIVYALSEAGFKEVMPEADAAYDRALASHDPYQLALVTNAMYNLGNPTKGKTALTALLKTQAGDGSFTGKKHSITVSGGQSLKVETTALAILAMLKGGGTEPMALQSAVQQLVSARSGGGFGSTQGTILALKSLVEYSKFSKKTNEAGQIEIHVNGKKVAETSYAAGRREAVEVKGLEAYLTEGKNTVEVHYIGVKNALPYSVGVNYFTTLPASNPQCVVDLETKLGSTSVKMGETVRLSATLKNLTDKGQPMTMAILGLPAGLSAQPWQLKELQEKKVFDFYEVIGNNVVCYYRQMTPNEVRNINLDLKADLPGRYTAPASSAYLYYTAEHKDWTALPQVQILN